MTSSFLLVFATAMFVYGLFRFVFFALVPKWKTRRRMKAKDLEAQAVVLNIRLTGHYVGNRPQVCMLVNVKPHAGRNFVAETKQVVSLVELSTLRAGSYLKVKYNNHNVKEIKVIR
jgi:hypothetical protein